MKQSITYLLATVLGATLLGACSDSSDSDDDNGGGNGGGGGTPTVEIRSNPPSDYARVDRMGQPAVATALLRGGGQPIRDSVPINNNADNERDSLNQGDPSGDADFAGAFVDTLIFVNNALADDLDSLGLSRCATGAPGEIDSADDINACLGVAAPVVIPDVVTLDISSPSSWPNGRHPDDPVVDRVLAAVLLDLSVHPLDLFADLPLNPPGNDARPDDVSPANFPYLRDPIAMP
ncbi:DUF4331 domain-containing protein [Parahaliea aestuarii]|uniref:DUF4331 domain-containing protein n=1 Tax=Parahaliea aestuarii TaxID=1852021 RepID=A0A5C8ZPL6_9GAMM|nr:DUF4331 domain-containing protein [Parahaliea aestuarii]TXS90433.1 DUF4331 domain-containing protein [Parahaliea aestuarii]